MVMMIPLRWIVRTDVRTAKTSSREVSWPGAHKAGRDWRFFWSSRWQGLCAFIGHNTRCEPYYGTFRLLVHYHSAVSPKPDFGTTAPSRRLWAPFLSPGAFHENENHP